MKRVIIVGSDGQDGRLLSDKFRHAGHQLLEIAHGTARTTERGDIPGIEIANSDDVHAVVEEWRPDEVYYLAAFHHSSQDRISIGQPELFRRSSEIHVEGLMHFLEAIRLGGAQARLFYAASCLIFGDTDVAVQNESTPFNPRCIYGITKTAGIHCCRYYRSAYGVYASTGILYNHESILRSEKFVFQKIIRAAIRISRADQEELVLGDLSTKIDWGFAPEFVEAMELILSLGDPNDFVIATGEPHTIEDLVQTAFDCLNLDWRKHVRIQPSLVTRQRSQLIGDSSRLRNITGWRPRVSFREMIERMIAGQIDAI